MAISIKGRCGGDQNRYWGTRSKGENNGEGKTRDRKRGRGPRDEKGSFEIALGVPSW